MIAKPGFCRALRAGEEAQVDALLGAAFDSGAEARLVTALRRSGAIAGEMVLPLNGEIAGYYALSHFRRPEGWLCLAPVAIHPEHQRQGHGRRMVGQLAEWARLTGQVVVVLGQAEFYQRAGFRRASAELLSSPYPIEHTLIAGPEEDLPKERLVYPAAFDGL